MQAGTRGVPLLDPVLAQQIMSFLKELTGPGVLSSFKATQAPLDSPIIVTTPKAGGNIDSDAFFHPLLGFVMTGNEHDTLTKFFKLKSHVFLDSKNENAYEFVTSCNSL